MPKSLRTLIWFVPVACFLLSGIGRTENIAPDELVKGVTEEVLTILRQDKEAVTGDKQRVMTLVEQKVAPHFDFPRMTSLAVGRAWQQAEPGQREALISEFHALLVRTYAVSLTAYRDQTVTFKPAIQQSGGDEVIVRSQINTPGARPISLDYHLMKSGDSWKVFDVAIANISLVTNYRSSFVNEIEKGGIAGLLKALQEKNRKGATDQPPAAA